MALSRNYVADLNDPGTRSRWERSTRRSGQDPTKNPYYRAALDGTTVAPLKTGSPMAKPLMASDSMAKPMQMPSAPPSQVSGQQEAWARMQTQLSDPASAAAGPNGISGYANDYANMAGALGGGSYQGMDSTPLAGSTPFGLQPEGKPSQSGATMLDKPTGMTVPSAPMPQPGDAGWNDISRYQRTSRGGHSNMPGMAPPGGSGVYNAASGLVPGGAGPISRGVHRMADNGVGAALTRGILGGQSANNQRYAQTARAQRQSDAQGNQLRELMANGRTMEQALAETGLKGNAEWDESARVARPRAAPRQMAGGGDRYGRYQP